MTIGRKIYKEFMDGKSVHGLARKYGYTSIQIQKFIRKYLVK